MGATEYIVRFKGDYSALAKDIQKINGETKKLADDEVIIKLNYDGNIQEFNKVFNKIEKMHPELGIQFQYNVNQKILEEEMNKLDKLTKLQIDIDEGQVQTKLNKLGDAVENAVTKGMSKEDIGRRIKDFYSYYNTALKAGAKNLDIGDIERKIDDAFRGASDDLQKIWMDAAEKIDKYKLFNIDKSLIEDISNAKERIKDLEAVIESLEKKGAGKTGLPSELQKVQDEIKILRSDIKDMQDQLGSLTGKAFDEMTESIKETNRQLAEAVAMVEKLSNLKTSNGESTDTSEVEETASETAKAAKEALRKAQDSNSPAELTKPLGKDFGLGYSEGIKEAIPDIVKSCQAIVLAAYEAVKDANKEEDTDGANFTDGFIEKFKSSLEKALPDIQNSINEIFSKIDIGEKDRPMFINMGEQIINSIIEGLKNNNSSGNITDTLNSIINKAFSETVLDFAVRDFMNNVQKSIDTAGDFRLKHFSVDSDSIIFQVQNALNNGTYSINVGGTIQELATTLNTSADNVRETFVDVINWMRQANEWQKFNKKDVTHERALWFNSKTGQFSNPTVVGDEELISDNLRKTILNYYKKQGEKFDTDLHWHQDKDYVAPSYSDGDIGAFFRDVFKYGIDKFIVAAQKEFAVFDFSKLASSKKGLEQVFNDWISKNIDEVKNVIGDQTYPEKTKLFSEYFSKVYKELLESIEGQLQENSKVVKKSNIVSLIEGLYTPFDEGIENSIQDLYEGEAVSFSDAFPELRDAFKKIIDDDAESLLLFNKMMSDALSNFREELQDAEIQGFDIDDSLISKMASDAVERVMPKNKITEDAVEIRTKFEQDFYKYMSKQIMGSVFTTTKPLENVRDQAGSMAMQQLINNDNPLGNLLKQFVKYYSPEQFEEEFGKGIVQSINQQDSKGEIQVPISPKISEEFQQKLADSIRDAISSGFEDVSIDDVGKILIKKIQDSIDNVTSLSPLIIKNFEPNTDNLIISIQNSLDEGTFNIDLSGTIKELSTTLNTSADNIRMSFLDAINWMRQANEWQKVNEDKTHERSLYFNSKTGEFSNPTVVGNETNISSDLKRKILEYYKEKGVIFDTNLHWHTDEDYAAPSSILEWSRKVISGDIGSFIYSAFEDFLGNISKFIVGAQKEIVMFDFSNVASDAQEFENFLKQWITDNFDEIEQRLQANRWADNSEDFLKNPRKTVGLYISSLYDELWEDISYGIRIQDLSEISLDQKTVRRTLQGFADGIISGNPYFISEDGEMLPIKEIFSDAIGEVRDRLEFNGVDSHIIENINKEFEEIIVRIFNDMFLKLGNYSDGLTLDKLKNQVNNSVDEILSIKSGRIGKINSDLQLDSWSTDGHLKYDFYELLKEHFFEPAAAATGVKDYQKAGSLAMKSLIKDNDLLGKIVKYYTPEEFEKEFGKNIVPQIPNSSQPTVQPTIPDDFQQQLQNAIEESGKYFIKVYGELVDNFKSELQAAIDDIGVFAIEVKPHVDENNIEINNVQDVLESKLSEARDRIEAMDLTDVQKNIAKDLLDGKTAGFSKDIEDLQELINLYKELGILQEAVKSDNMAFGTRITTIPLDQVQKNQNVSPTASAMQSEVEAVNQAIEAEKKKFDELKNKISKTIPTAVDKKNEAFEEERDLVAKVVDDEVDYFDVLNNTINGVTNSIEEQYDVTKNAKPKLDTSDINSEETNKTDLAPESRKTKTTLLSLDEIEQKIREIGLSTQDTEKAIALLGGSKQSFSWMNSKLEDQYDKVNALVEIFKRLGIVISSVENSEAWDTTISTNSILDFNKQQYQSVGQKSKIQQEMAEYYTAMQKEADTIYSNAQDKTTKLLQQISKLESSNKYTEAFKTELANAKKELGDFLKELAEGTIPFEKVNDKVKELADNVENTLSRKAFKDVKLAAEKSLTNVGLKIDQIIAKNSAMGESFKSKFKALKDELDDQTTVEGVQKIIAAVNRLESEIIAAGKTGKSFIDQIKQRLRDINSKYIAQYFSFQDIIRYARQAAQNIIQLNDAFIELSKVSDASLKELEADFQSYADIAKSIGGTITDTINATADWARMGYSVPDSKKLAEVAMLYKNVGDGIDISQANESLISTLQAFQMTADESERIVDVFNEVANNYAITSGGIGEALQRSAASLNAANTSLEESVALVTAANTVVQNPESVGTTFKTLSARIRGASTELADLGEEEDEFTQTTSKLQSLVKGLTGFDILEADQKTFKSIYDILVGIGKEWKNLTDIERASLGEALAGKRNANTLYAVLDNIETLEAAYETAENSAGSAQREQENYQKGITYSINQTKAALEELSYDLMNSDFLKGLVDTATNFIELIDKIIDKFGTLQTLVIGLGTFIGTQKIGQLPGGIKQLFSNGSEVKNQSNIDMLKDYELFKAGAGLQYGSKDVKSIKDIADHYKDASDAAKDFMSNVENAKIEIEEGKDVSEAFIEQFSSGISNIGKGIVNLGKTIGATLGKAALSGLISFAVTMAIQGIAKIGKMIWDNLLTDNGKIQRMKDAISSLSSVTNEYIQSNKDLDDVIEKYEELNTKLSDENITATEAFEIKKDLIGLQDELKEAYGSEASNVDLVTGSYKEQLEVLQKIKKEKASDYLREATKTPEKTFIDYFKVSDDIIDKSNANRVYDYLYEKLDKTSKIGTRDLIGKNAKTFEDIYGFNPSILEKYSALNYREMFNPTNDRATMLFDFTGDRKTINDQLSELFTELRNLYPNNPEVQAFMDEVGSIDIGFDSEAYDEALKEARQIVDALMITDTDDANAYDLQERAGEAVKAYNEALAKYQTDRSTDNEAELQKASDNLNSIENEINSYAQKNADYLGNYLQVYQDMFGDIMGGKGQTIEDKLQEKFYDSIDMSKSTGGMLEKQYKEFIGSLDEDDYKLLTSIDIDEFDSLEELRDVLDEMKEAASQEPIEVDLSPQKAISELDELEKRISSVDTVYQEVINEGKVASGSNMESLNSAFGGITEEVNGVEVYTNLSSAILQCNKDIMENVDNTDKQREAFDRLLTATMDLDDELVGLTEDNQDYYKDLLTLKGYTNANEVVTSRLNKTYKATRKNLEELSEAIANNRKELTSYPEDSPEFLKAIDNIKPQVNNLLGTYDLDTGELVQAANLDNSFIIANLQDIFNMIEGDNDALDRLYNKVAELNAEQILIDAGLDTTEIDGKMDNIKTMLEIASTWTMEPEALLDNSQFMTALNACYDGSAATANAINAALGTIGLKADFKKTGSTTINVPAGYEYQPMFYGSGAGSSVIKAPMVKTEPISLDNFELVTTSTGKGTAGKGVHFGGTPTKSSGGGGGGGGGGGSSSEPNKPKQEAEETFDWIEVAIQRIEEEIARLDKVVGNSYDIWINRNKALLKEIDKTREEIKAQQIAYSEYLRNANKVEVNNGKGLNPDDYGENDAEVKKRDQELLDEAKAAWKTGEYQKKVREGLLTGDDIENIANHFLSDTIKSYQELYNKAIAASDATQDLKIQLGDLAKTKFDQVKTQAEETLQYFEAYSGLIDERINRTEEKGYFVSKKYYNDLVKYENKSLETLRKEYNDLIAKRDEAVASGDIANNSEAWHEMNQEILGVAQSIEEATTKLFEYANTMRQIDWDVFDYVQERISKVTDEFEFLIDLLDNQKMYDDYGIFNERGWANTALHASKYNTYMQQALDYAEERRKIETQLKADEADKNLIERREELIQLQQESIQNAYAEKDAVKSLVEEGINIHLSKLKELIDDYKKAQQESKSLYDYQKNISKQTENIGNLRKQLNAYVGDTSEEARATIQKLSKSLEDAETQLKETQWDKYISETETFLSDMYDEYEETLNARLDDIDLLMHDMIDEVNARGTEIGQIIKDVSNEVAYKFTDNVDKLIGDGTLVSDFKNKFDTYATNTKTMLDDIKSYIAKISDNMVTAAVNTTISDSPTGSKSSINTPTRINYNAVKDGVDYNGIFDLNYYMNKYPDLQSVFGNDYAKYLEHFIQYGMKEGRQASETFNLEYYKKRYPDLVKAFGNNNEAYYKHFLEYGMKEGRQASETFNVQVYKALYEGLRKAFANDLKQYYKHYNMYGIAEGRRAYATGSKHISSDQLAWTQDGGGELIYRSTDGAILTPLNVGDKVFTAEMSENLWNLAQLKQRPVASTGTGRTVNNNNAITISLPNVQNYEQFKNALQNDPKMTQFIQQVTFGEATNGIKLNRKKY